MKIKYECSGESGVHHWISTGSAIICRHCGEPFEHKHELERNAEKSDSHREIYICVNDVCEYTETEENDTPGA